MNDKKKRYSTVDHTYPLLFPAGQNDYFGEQDEAERATFSDPWDHTAYSPCSFALDCLMELLTDTVVVIL